MPFLENVTRGRDVPPERLAKVAEHYLHFGGVSPINAQNRALVAAVADDFAAHGLDLPVYLGNRNWQPYVGDVVAEMAQDGIKNALVFVTSAYASFSACRQYQDDLVSAASSAGPTAPELHKLRHYFDHPGFIEPQRDSLRATLSQVRSHSAGPTSILFVAHSVPQVMAAASGPHGGLYTAQLEAVSSLVAEAAHGIAWRLVYCSRSGPPSVPWLEPDIKTAIRELGDDGVENVVVVPIGFVSEHIEVLWDLDTEACAEALGHCGDYYRTEPPAADRRFVAMVRELVQERLDRSAPRRALSTLGPSHDLCPASCCRLGSPRG